MNGPADLSDQATRGMHCAIQLCELCRLPSERRERGCPSQDCGEQRWHTADAVRVEMLAEERCEEAVCDEWLPLELR